MSERKVNTLKQISILLGLLSIANMILLGIYVINCCLSLASLLSKFYTEAAYVGFATAISVILTIFGCYSMYKSHFLRGGISNLTAGIITTGIYLNYTLNLAILQKFGLPGYFLLLPALISGIIGIIISKI